MDRLDHDIVQDLLPLYTTACARRRAGRRWRNI